MKAIFLDIDGTLTTPGSNIPPESALAAIRKAQEKGNPVFLCSGRNEGMLRPLLQYGFDGYIACAGGYVVVGDKVLYDDPMPDEDRDTALELLHKHGVFCTIETRDMTYGDTSLGKLLEGTASLNSEIERWRKALAEGLNIRPIEEYDGAPAYKIVVMAQRYDQLNEAKEALEDRYDFVMQEVPEHGNVINGELIKRTFDKGKGVRIVSDHLGITLADTVGFGDSMNDLAMIETVHTSVCMGNGAEALKKISDHVADSVESDGLYKAFATLQLM